MSDCVFEALEGLLTHANPDVGFAQQVYNAWTGSDELIKPQPEKEFSEPLMSRLLSFKTQHPRICNLFNAYEEATETVWNDADKIMESIGTQVFLIESKDQALRKFYDSYFTTVFNSEYELFHALPVHQCITDQLEELCDNDDGNSNSSISDGHGQDNSNDDDEDNDEDDDDNSADDDDDDDDDAPQEDDNVGSDCSHEDDGDEREPFNSDPEDDGNYNGKMEPVKCNAIARAMVNSIISERGSSDDDADDADDDDDDDDDDSAPEGIDEETDEDDDQDDQDDHPPNRKKSRVA